MRILVLGGTQFLGRAFVAAALDGGHDVTVYTRGKTNPDLFPKATHVRGDRDVSLEPLAGLDFDAVVDTCGYHPRPVGESARRFFDAHYLFVSTLSAYADPTHFGLHEGSPLADLPGDLPGEFVPDLYGPLKVRCEEAVAAACDRALIIRPGLIVGPYDYSDRFTYWAVRAARGGTILAPGRRDAAVQVIDARDLAAWMLSLVERAIVGVFNATGPDTPATMGGLIDACRSASNTASMVVWAPEDFLLSHDVTPWTEMPVWLPEHGEHAGLMHADSSAAFANGLRVRPLTDTARDTLGWFRSERRDALKAGLSAERESELLAALRRG